jgi:hypothetical protein
MAALSASPMPYRNFVAAPTAKQQIEYKAAFPLLVTVLPEVVQFPIPHVPDLRIPTSDRPASPLPEPQQANPVAIEPRAPAKPVAGRPDVRRAPDQIGAGPKSLPSAPRDLSRHHVPLTRGQNEPTPGPRVADGQKTPLAALFRRLQVENPSSEQRTEAQSTLRDMLSRI